MKPEIKELWVNALRSGDYDKGYSQLRDLDDHYDVTGVLCDLAVRAGVIGEPRKFDAKGSSFFGYAYSDGTKSMATGLPDVVCKWADIPYRVAYSLALKGDSGMSFDKLADKIEKEL